MKKILIYAQSSVGIGHFERMVLLGTELSKYFLVQIIHGGLPVENYNIPNNIHVHYLPPIYFDGKLCDIDKKEPSTSHKQYRLSELIRITTEFSPDMVITEFFPFGRYEMSFELIPWLEFIKEYNPKIKIISSIRDIIDNGLIEQHHNFVIDCLDRFYDSIFIHAEAKFIPNLNFVIQNYKRIPIKYTGYISNNSHLEHITTPTPYILVSMGGGRTGQKIIESIIKVSNSFDYDFLVFSGPYAKSYQINDLLNKHDAKNVIIASFSNSIRSYMNNASLSISQAGYNTMMNILSLGTPGIVIPHKVYKTDEEQYSRAKSLERIGNFSIINEEEMTEELLYVEISKGLNKNKKSASGINLNGAYHSTDYIRNMLLR